MSFKVRKTKKQLEDTIKLLKSALEEYADTDNWLLDNCGCNEAYCTCFELNRVFCKNKYDDGYVLASETLRKL